MPISCARASSPLLCFSYSVYGVKPSLQALTTFFVIGRSFAWYTERGLARITTAQDKYLGLKSPAYLVLRSWALSGSLGKRSVPLWQLGS